MAFRNLVAQWLGNQVARRIEQFVDGTLFGDSFVTCPQCSTPVAATLLAERGVCPIRRTTPINESMIEAVEARQRAELAAGEAANKKFEETEGLIATRPVQAATVGSADNPG